MAQLDTLDTPQLLIDLDILDANLARMRSLFAHRELNIRVHFKSLKCGSLARYLLDSGISRFLAAKLNEAEVLADHGIQDILLANQIVGERKILRLCELAKRSQLRVCVDDADNIQQLGLLAARANVTVGVLVEVDIGMGRCGVPPGAPALELVRVIDRFSHLRFDGLQGYDGQLQLIADASDRNRQCLQGLASLSATRHLLESESIKISMITGAGTGTCETVGNHPAMTEIQPGSFLLMDAAYRAVQPQFSCSLSLLSTIISRRTGQYVLDAGSKAISRDFGMPVLKNTEQGTIVKLAEEHTIVESDQPARIGDRREVLPTHCCATMNLHRSCIVHRGGTIVDSWPIEASGRYD